MKKAIEKKPKTEKKTEKKQERILFNQSKNYVCSDTTGGRYILADTMDGARFQSFEDAQKGFMISVPHAGMAIDLAVFHGFKVIEMDSPAKALEFVLAQYLPKKSTKKTLTAKKSGGKVK
jgi:hypothetical protein